MELKTYENIIEKESKSFSIELFQAKTINSLSNLKDRLNTKLYDFTLDSYKIRFLNKLKDFINKDLISFGSTDDKYSFVQDRKLGLFVIDSELQSHNMYYQPEIIEGDKFTDAEVSLINSKLNQILEEIKLLSCGQEVIFNEIDELRDYLKLGKKITRQLIYGKLKDIVFTKGVEMSIVEPIFESLIHSIGDIGKNIISNS
ncbi:MAG: hypothetical protein U0W24_11995 [Bacteroidales bacterium]